MKIRHFLYNAEPESILGGAAAPVEPVESTEPTESLVIDDGWLKGVEKDLASDKIMESVKDVPTLVKNYVHAQRMVGKDKAILPNENSTPEEIRAFYHKMGLPQEDEYKIELEKNLMDEEFTKEFNKLAYENNILPHQAKAIMEFYNGKIAEEDEAHTTSTKESIDTAVQALKDEWGEGYGKNMQKALDVINMFDNDMGIMQHLDTTGLGNDTKLIKFLANVGNSLNEDTFSKDAVAHYGVSKEEAQEQINNTFADSNHAYHKTEHPNHAKAVADMNKLFKIIS